MLNKGIHPTVIAESFQRAAGKAVEYLTDIATPIELDDKESLLRAASTSLNSKVSRHGERLHRGGLRWAQHCQRRAQCCHREAEVLLLCKEKMQLA